MLQKLISRALLLMPLLAAHSVQAEVKEYIRDYNYHGEQYDTVASCRINAIDGVKRELLEELGTYVGSVINQHQDSLGNTHVSHDVVNITAGIVALKVLDEKWKQPLYYVKAGMKADPDDVMTKLKALRADLELEKSLRNSNEELARARVELEELRAQLAAFKKPKGSAAVEVSALPSTAANNRPAKAESPKLVLNEKTLVANYQKTLQNIEVEEAFQRGLVAQINGDLKAAMKEMSVLAEKGYAKAQLKLGWLYERGVVEAINFKKAREWYEKAEANGDVDAPASIGRMYELGMGVDVDYGKAEEYYAKSIAMDSGLGYAYMGNLYEFGKGKGLDRLKAVEYYEKAMARGDYISYSRMAMMYFHGRGGLPRDIHKSIELHKQAIDHGVPLSMAYLGHIYNTGGGERAGMPELVDHDKALRLIKEATRYHLKPAYAFLGYMYENGWSVKQDYQEARTLYEKAANSDVPFALQRLGFVYKDGLGVQRDFDRAAEYFRKAAALGDDRSQAVLNKRARW